LGMQEDRGKDVGYASWVCKKDESQASGKIMGPRDFTCLKYIFVLYIFFSCVIGVFFITS